MSKFSVGEIAVIVSAPGGPSCAIGQEVKILGLPGVNQVYPRAYVIDVSAFDQAAWSPGFGSGAACIYEEHLRKKKPPKDEDRYDGNDVISWEDDRSVWKPERIEA